MSRSASQHLGDALAPDDERDLADMLPGVEQRLADRLPGGVDHPLVGGDPGNVRGEHQRSIVPSRRIFRCSCRIPYSNASAVGGQPGT